MSGQLTLNPNARLFYGQMLQPKPGFELECGVCCTYSLDFEALLGALISLEPNGESDVEKNQNSIALMAALRKTINKLTFFCSDWEIKIPKSKERRLDAFLEQSVFEVNPQKSVFPKKRIFHPKVWVMLFSPKVGNKANSYVKVITLSRNLTWDRSMDYAIELQGDVCPDAKNKDKNKALQRNQPLIDFLNYLVPFVSAENSEKRRQIQYLVKKIALVQAFDSNFSDKEPLFAPLGIGEAYSSDKLDLFSSRKTKDYLICVSPFLSDGITQRLVQNVSNPVKTSLLTRQESITPVTCGCFDRICRVKEEAKNDNFLENTTPQISEDAKTPYREIHAKMFLYRSCGETHFYFGSANATQNAFYNNVEFLLHLQSSSSNSEDYKKWSQDLLGFDGKGEFNEDSPFEWAQKVEFVPDDFSETAQSDILVSLRIIRDLIHKARVEKKDGRYQIVLECAEEIMAWNLRIAPFAVESYEIPLKPDAVIENLSASQISQWYIISIPENGVSPSGIKLPAGRHVTKIPTENIPQCRAGEIFNMIVKDEKDLLSYISRYIAEYRDPAFFTQDERHSEKIQGVSNQLKTCCGREYEALLRLAAQSPKNFTEMLKDISRWNKWKENNSVRDLLITFAKALDIKENWETTE